MVNRIPTIFSEIFVRRPAPLIKLPQARVLAVLAGGALLGRAELGARAGFTPASGTPTRVLNGIRAGSSSGAAHPGLLALGLVEAVTVDHDGKEELVYRITARGRAAYAAWLAAGGKIGALKDKKAATNQRYKGKANAETSAGKAVSL